MDTIIYFYQKRSLEEPLVEPIGQGSYLLVKVAMDVGEGRWFQVKLPVYGQQAEASGKAVPGKEILSRKGNRDLAGGERKGFWPRWISVLGQGRDRRKQERRRRLWQEAFRQASGQVEAGVAKLVRQIGEFVEDWQECRCLYDGAVGKWLVPRQDLEEGKEKAGRMDGAEDRPDPGTGTAGKAGTGHLPEGDSVKYLLPRLWQKHWDIPEFTDFFGIRWVEPLLSAARLPHFMILGNAPCVPEVILACADRMRSLRWVLRKEDVTQQIQDFLEDFYLDYGLAVILQPLEGSRGDPGYDYKSQAPVCVLDFSGGERFLTGAVCRGSIWLDMASQEKKERRFLGRDSGVTYHSLRTFWREARRRMPDWAAILKAQGCRPEGELLPQWLREEGR